MLKSIIDRAFQLSQAAVIIDYKIRSFYLFIFVFLGIHYKIGHVLVHAVSFFKSIFSDVPVCSYNPYSIIVILKILFKYQRDIIKKYFISC